MPRREPLRRCQGLRWRLDRRAQSFMQDEADELSAEYIGVNLKRIREENNLTIRSLADLSGLSVNALSLIENGKSSPSVKSLVSIANSLNIPVAYFFSNPVIKPNISYLKAGQRPVANIPQGILENLGAGLTTKLEPYLMTLEPFSSRNRHELMHAGYEFVYCLEGKIAYTILDDVYLLEKDDSIFFEANLPHSWQNLSDKPSKCILILFSSDESNSTADLHFSFE